MYMYYSYAVSNLIARTITQFHFRTSIVHPTSQCGLGSSFLIRNRYSPCIAITMIENIQNQSTIHVQVRCRKSSEKSQLGSIQLSRNSVLESGSNHYANRIIYVYPTYLFSLIISQINFLSIHIHLNFHSLIHICLNPHLDCHFNSYLNWVFNHKQFELCPVYIQKIA